MGLQNCLHWCCVFVCLDAREVGKRKRMLRGMISVPIRTIEKKRRSTMNIVSSTKRESCKTKRYVEDNGRTCVLPKLQNEQDEDVKNTLAI